MVYIIHCEWFKICSRRKPCLIAGKELCLYKIPHVNTNERREKKLVAMIMNRFIITGWMNQIWKRHNQNCSFSEFSMVVSLRAKECTCDPSNRLASVVIVLKFTSFYLYTFWRRNGEGDSVQNGDFQKLYDLLSCIINKFSFKWINFLAVNGKQAFSRLFRMPDSSKKTTKWNLCTVSSFFLQTAWQARGGRFSGAPATSCASH